MDMMPEAHPPFLKLFLHVIQFDVRHCDLRLQTDHIFEGRDSGWHGSHGLSRFANDPTFNFTIHYAGEDGSFFRAMHCTLLPYFMDTLSLQVYNCSQTAILVDGRFITREIPNLCILVRVALRAPRLSRDVPRVLNVITVARL